VGGWGGYTDESKAEIYLYVKESKLWDLMNKWRGQTYRISGDSAPLSSQASRNLWGGTLIKKKINFSSYIRKFRVEQLQSHI
jgi:hypothetical protein